jgi:hypothetical protein
MFNSWGGTQMRHRVGDVLIVAKPFLISALVAASATLANATSIFAQMSNQIAPSSIEDQSPFRLKVTSNLVVVRVVDLASNQPNANAPTYVDYPMQKLRTSVPALEGIKPDASQDQLASILSKVAQRTSSHD